MKLLSCRPVAKGSALFIMFLSALMLCVPAARGGSPADVEGRVEDLLRRLTLDEKIKLMSGTEDQMHIPGIPRLGITSVKFSDGPVGVRCWGKSTTYPAGAMLAATWDADLAFQMGRALGRDCRARGGACAFRSGRQSLPSGSMRS